MSLAPTLIIFDFDGVVADSETIANQALADYITSLGKPTTLDDSIRLFMGKRFEDTKRLVVEWMGRDLPATFEEDYRAKTRFCVISFTSDWLYPTRESKEIVKALNAVAANVSFVEIESDKGHDAFLLEEPTLFATVSGFINSNAARRGIR